MKTEGKYLITESTAMEKVDMADKRKVSNDMEYNLGKFRTSSGKYVPHKIQKDKTR